MNSYSARTMAKCLIFAWGASTSSAIARRPAEKPAKFSYHVVGSRYLHCCKQGQAKPLLAPRGMAAKAQLFSDLILSTHSISNAGLLAFSLMKSVTFFLQFFFPPPCNGRSLLKAKPSSSDPGGLIHSPPVAAIVRSLNACCRLHHWCCCLQPHCSCLHPNCSFLHQQPCCFFTSAVK